MTLDHDVITWNSPYTPQIEYNKQGLLCLEFKRTYSHYQKVSLCHMVTDMFRMAKIYYYRYWSNIAQFEDATCASFQIRQILVGHVPGMPGSFPRHRLQRKPLNRGAGENVPGILGACIIRNFTYLLRSPWDQDMACFLLWFNISRSTLTSGLTPGIQLSHCPSTFWTW